MMKAPSRIGVTVKTELSPHFKTPLQRTQDPIRLVAPGSAVDALDWKDYAKRGGPEDAVLRAGNPVQGAGRFGNSGDARKAFLAGGRGNVDELLRRMNQHNVRKNTQSVKHSEPKPQESPKAPGPPTHAEMIEARSAGREVLSFKCSLTTEAQNVFLQDGQLLSPAVNGKDYPLTADAFVYDKAGREFLGVYTINDGFLKAAEVSLVKLKSGKAVLKKQADGSYKVVAVINFRGAIRSMSMKMAGMFEASTDVAGKPLALTQGEDGEFYLSSSKSLEAIAGETSQVKQGRLSVSDLPHEYQDSHSRLRFSIIRDPGPNGNYIRLQISLGTKSSTGNVQLWFHEDGNPGYAMLNAASHNLFGVYFKQAQGKSFRSYPWELLTKDSWLRPDHRMVVYDLMNDRYLEITLDLDKLINQEAVRVMSQEETDEIGTGVVYSTKI